MTKEEKLKECRGCMSGYSREYKIENCVVFKYANIRECPCLNCLVKVTCNVACEPISKMVDRLIRELHP